MTQAVPERLPRGIRRLPNGRYRVRKGNIDKRARTYADALELYHQLHDPTGRRRDTSDDLATYLGRWLDGRQDLADSSRRKYEDNLAFYVRPFSWIARRRLETLTAADFDHYFRELGEHVGIRTGRRLSPNTIRGVRRMLNAALKQAAERGYMPSNPVPLAQVPRGETVHRVPPTPDQVERILAAVAGHRLEALVQLVARTGLRKGEVMALAWPAVDLDARTIRIVANLKTPASRRELAIEDGLVQVLRDHRARQQVEARRSGWANDGDLVFTTRWGRALDPDYVLSVAKRAIDQAGVAAERRAARLHPLTLHDLRHAFATHAAAGGVEAEKLSKFLGHSTLATTVDLYYHPTVEDLRTVTVRHAAYMANGSHKPPTGPLPFGPVRRLTVSSEHDKRR